MSAEEFAENRDFFDDSRKANIDEAFKKFLEQYGPDVAKGYLMALVDMQPNVSEVYCQHTKGHWSGDNHFNINSYTVMTSKAHKLTLHVGDLLQIGSTLTGYPEQSYLNSVKVPRRKL